MPKCFSRAGRPVLLAPAGSPGAVMAALQAGADAIYVGLKGWSRGGAKGELSAEELLDALGASHARGRQLQVAINTIPRQRERRYLVERVEELIDRGVDGVIGLGSALPPRSLPRCGRKVREVASLITRAIGGIAPK